MQGIRQQDYSHSPKCGLCLQLDGLSSCLSSYLPTHSKVKQHQHAFAPTNTLHQPFHLPLLTSAKFAKGEDRQLQ